MASFRKAFSMSKADVKSATPPGTVVLINNDLVRSSTGHHEHTEKHVHLQPEPSPDPADPLNFPFWSKLAILFLMSAYAFISTASSSIISSALPDLVTAFATFNPRGPPTGIVPFSDLTQLIAVNNLMLGAANIWWVPLSNIYGRRPILLLNLAMLAGFSFWCSEAKSFNSLLAARVFQGIGGAAADTLSPDVVGRIFFVHQRGRAMAIYTIFLASGSLIGGLIGGYISSAHGWRWTLRIPGIIAAVLFLLTFLLMPETLFNREKAMAIAGQTNPKLSSTDEKNPATKIERVSTADTAASHPSQLYPPFTYPRSLSFPRPHPFSLRPFYTPYLTLLLPGTLMVTLHYAALVGLIVTISTVAPNILAAPPYLWGANVGLINAGGLIGTVLGAVYTYFTTDWLAKRSARRDRDGMYEPEERLVLMWPALGAATAGALVFGFSAQYGGARGWVGLEVGVGMVAAGLMLAPSVGFGYVIEAYGGLASDCFLMVVSFRAIISFAWIFFVGDWVASRGAAEPFGIFALLMGLFGLALLPVWLYGKRLRIGTEAWVRKAETREL